jgi:hypothetical protein
MSQNPDAASGGPAGQTSSQGSTVQQSFIAAKGANIPDQSTWTIDQGVDIPFAAGTPMLAVGPGKITASGISGFSNGPNDCPVLTVTDGPLKGKSFYYGHCGPMHVNVGDTVNAGQIIVEIGSGIVGMSTGPHIEFGLCSSAGQPNCSGGGPTSCGQEALGILVKLQAGALIDSTTGGGSSTSTPAGTTGAGSSAFTQDDLYAIGRASAVSTQFNLPGILNASESIFMRGAKSIYNDEPIMGFVEQLCKASLRSFQSLPNGAFFAFFPDYFGAYGHRVPYWNIENVEIVDGGIDLTDESLATHVFVVGDTGGLPDGTIDLAEKIASKGVVTIFDAFASKFMIQKSQDTTDSKTDDNTQAFEEAFNFLRKYGIRPHYEEAPFIRNSYFEMFYAFTQFQLLWANQFRTQFAFTFMPELYPGGIVSFDEHGIQCYIDSVTHTFDYTGGFTTQANLTAPSSIAKPGGTNISAGMLRALPSGFEGGDVQSTEPHPNEASR